MKNSSFPTSAIYLTVLYLVFSIAANAQNAGTLDPTFGSGGIVTTHLFQNAVFTDQIIQPDKKIVVIGGTFAPVSMGQFIFTGMAARFNEDGALEIGRSLLTASKRPKANPPVRAAEVDRTDY